jgi:hypothetical protein
MSKVNKFLGISVGDKIMCIIPRYAAFGQKGIVEEIKKMKEQSMDCFSGRREDGSGFLFSGEEITRVS